MREMRDDDNNNDQDDDGDYSEPNIGFTARLERDVRTLWVLRVDVMMLSKSP